MLRTSQTSALLLAAAVLACMRQPRTTELPPAAVTPAISDIQKSNDSLARVVMMSIAGKEQLPANQVFQNVTGQLANTPAGRLVSIMNGGYARALGVRCSHCHAVDNFASDEKRPKRAAREMQVMHRTINQMLAGMKDIATPPDQNRAINCALCHRGQAVPR